MLRLGEMSRGMHSRPEEALLVSWSHLQVIVLPGRDQHRSVILLREFFGLFGDNVVSRELEEGSCEESEFHCSSGECLDIGKLCNGSPDCRDRSDEDINRWIYQKFSRQHAN